MNKSKIPILLVVFGFLVIMTALGIFLFPRIFSTHQPDLLPSTLGGHLLKQAIYGPKAVDGVIQLHGVDFPMENAAIGQYGTQSEVMLWVSVESDMDAAIQLTNLMTEKINQGRSPFSFPIAEEINEVTVYVLDGLGQQQYYWQKDDLIIWISVDFSLADEVLVEALRFYE